MTISYFVVCDVHKSHVGAMDLQPERDVHFPLEEDKISLRLYLDTHYGCALRLADEHHLNLNYNDVELDGDDLMMTIQREKECKNYESYES